MKDLSVTFFDAMILVIMLNAADNDDLGYDVEQMSTTMKFKAN